MIFLDKPYKLITKFVTILVNSCIFCSDCCSEMIQKMTQSQYQVESPTDEK